MAFSQWAKTVRRYQWSARLGHVWTFPLLEPQEVVFLTGAGISVDGPTSGPLGNELTFWALDHAFLPETLHEVQDAYEALGLDSQRVPRLEAILEIVAAVHGPAALGSILSALETAKPNSLHQFFGEHLQLGGRHITANFDMLIEKTSPSTEVTHFHGQLKPGAGGYEHLGARLSRIERGFEPKMREQLHRALETSQPATLLIVGYSGSDYFDMDPFIHENAPALSKNLARVVWVQHDTNLGSAEFVLVSDVAAYPAMLRSLSDAGVVCEMVRCHTLSALNQMSDQWGLARIVTTKRVRRTGPPPVSDTLSRAMATRRLYRHMGMYRSDDELLKRWPELAAKVGAADRAETAWQDGDIALAGKYWSVLHAGKDDDSRAMYFERVASCHRSRGSFMRAYFAARSAVRHASANRDPDVLGLALETQARILVQMSRSPDLFWFSTKRRRTHLAQKMEQLDADSNMTTHVANRVRDARSLLVDDPEALRLPTWGARRLRKLPGPATSHPGAAGSLNAPTREVASFLEYESLSAVVDYRRGQIRRAAASGQVIPDSVVSDYLRAARFLGKNAGVRDFFTVPGVADHYDLREVLDSLGLISASPWHKLRLLGKWLRSSRDHRS